MKAKKNGKKEGGRKNSLNLSNNNQKAKVLFVCLI